MNEHINQNNAPEAAAPSHRAPPLRVKPWIVALIIAVAVIGVGGYFSFSAWQEAYEARASEEARGAELHKPQPEKTSSTLAVPSANCLAPIQRNKTWQQPRSKLQGWIIHRTAHLHEPAETSCSILLGFTQQGKVVCDGAYR